MTLKHLLSLSSGLTDDGSGCATDAAVPGATTQAACAKTHYAKSFTIFRLQSLGALRSASLCSFSEAAFPHIFAPISRFSHENVIFRVFFSSFENRRSRGDSCANTLRRPGPFLVASRAIHRVNYIISAKNMGTFRTAPWAGASRGHRVSSSNLKPSGYRVKTTRTGRGIEKERERHTH